MRCSQWLKGHPVVSSTCDWHGMHGFGCGLKALSPHRLRGSETPDGSCTFVSGFASLLSGSSVFLIPTKF